MMIGWDPISRTREDEDEDETVVDVDVGDDVVGVVDDHVDVC